MQFPRALKMILWECFHSSGWAVISVHDLRPKPNRISSVNAVATQPQGKGTHDFPVQDTVNAPLDRLGPKAKKLSKA